MNHSLITNKLTQKICTLALSFLLLYLMSSTILLSEILECKIDKRLKSDRIELQKRWMPDVTVHELEKTNGTKITSPKSIKMSGKLSRNESRKLINLRYRFEMKKPHRLEVNYSYKPSKGLLKVYSTASTQLLKLNGLVATGKCKEVKRIVVKPKVARKAINTVKKITIPVKPAYRIGTTLNSLNIYFQGSQSVDFMCQLEAVFNNVTTNQQTIIPFYPNIDGTGQEILKTDLENEFIAKLPELDVLSIKIRSLPDSSCSPKSPTNIPLFKNTFDKLVAIDLNGNIKISNFQINNLP